MASQTWLWTPEFDRGWDLTDKRLVLPKDAEWLARVLEHEPEIFIDYEGGANGTAPFMLGLHTPDLGPKVVDFRLDGGKALREASRDGLTRRGPKLTVAYNIAFEMECQRREGGLANWLPWDPMHAAYAINELRKDWKTFGAFTQKALIWYELGVDAKFAAAVRAWLKSNMGVEDENSGWDLVPAQLMVNYNCEDLEYGAQLYRKLRKQVEANGQGELVQTDSYVTDIVERMGKRGIAFDRERAKALESGYSTRFKEVVKDIYDNLGRSNFDFNSHQKVFGLLYGEWRLPMHPDIEKQGKVDDDTLKWMTAQPEVANNPRRLAVIEGIREARELFKLNDTYLRPWLHEHGTDGVLHGKIYMMGARTRRFSMHDPNLQNVPVRTDLGADLRSAFVSRKGWTTYSMDESQAEYRMFASFSGNLRLCKGYRDDRNFDIHVEVAVMMGLIELLGAEKGRKFAKNVNFGVLYNMGIAKLMRSLGCSEQRARRVMDEYYAKIMGIRELRDRLKQFVRAHGYVETPFKGRRHLSDDESYKALNTLCQMSVADLIRRAMRLADPIITAAGGNMLLQVHDELIFELPGEDTQVHLPTLRQIKEEAMESTEGFGFKVPFRSDCERWAPNWQNSEAVQLAA